MDQMIKNKSITCVGTSDATTAVARCWDATMNSNSFYILNKIALIIITSSPGITESILNWIYQFLNLVI